MAGGSLAQDVACLVCLTAGTVAKATRTREGDESDEYRCEAGHEFGVDWSRGPATEAQWPPPPQLAALARTSADRGS